MLRLIFENNNRDQGPLQETLCRLELWISRDCVVTVFPIQEARFHWDTKLQGKFGAEMGEGEFWEALVSFPDLLHPLK